jgi:hypothetical protein
MTNEMREQLERYFEYELRSLRQVAKFHPNPATWIAKDDVIRATLSRGLGVILFAQLNGAADYCEVGRMYDAFKAEVEKI